MTGTGKLDLVESRVSVSINDARQAALRVLDCAGCKAQTAGEIVDHLIDADLCGVESHGIFRALQYADEYRRGYLQPNAEPSLDSTRHPTCHVDGHGGIGITALSLAVQAGIDAARRYGITAIAVRNTGHTGRLGAFAEMAAKGAMPVHRLWRGCARTLAHGYTPTGAAKAVLPTNPWCLGIPGGELGPIILDCATGQIAGGWIYAARRGRGTSSRGRDHRSHGAPVPEPRRLFCWRSHPAKRWRLGIWSCDNGRVDL